MKILVIGSTNIDFVVGVRQMPAVGETVMSQSFDKFPGGKGANQAYACGKLGGDTVFMSAVGDDGLGQIVIDNMLGANVDISCLKTVPDCPTGMAYICVNEDGNNNIVVVPGANSHCDKAYVSACEQQIQTADILLTQLEIPREGAYLALQEAKRLGKTTILNPAPVPDEPIPEEVLQGLSYITPNESELCKITGMPVGTLEEIAAAARELLGRGVHNVVVTIGAKGALLVNEGTQKVFTPVDLPPVDTTAAGDTFNAALAVKMAEGCPIDEALDFANAAATLSITKKGAQSSVPGRSEVLRFMEQYSGAIAGAR